MTTYDFGEPTATTLLIQPVDDHDLSVIENEVAVIRELTRVPFRLIAVKVGSWNRDLSPWEAPPVFGSEGFGASFVGDDVYKSVDRGHAEIPGGKTHQQGAAPGYEMYYVWMVRHIDGDPWIKTRIYAPEHEWLANS